MKIKVGVFFGGRSVEHEVSVITGLQAVRNFDREKYDVLPIYISREGAFYCGADVDKIESYRDIGALIARSVRVLPSGEGGRLALLRHEPKKFGSNVYDVIDVALPAVHGTNAEDGTLQGFLQMLGVPYAGCDVLSSALGMDKFTMKAVLRAAGIPVLDAVRFSAKEWTEAPDACLDEAERRIGYPVIIKPVNLGSSVGIKLAHDRDGLRGACDYAFDFASAVLAERAVENLREINCSVLGDGDDAEAGECEEPVNTDEILSYEDKYCGGGKGSKGGGGKGMSGLKRLLPAPIAPELREKIRAMAADTFRALGCAGVARIDFLLDGERVFVNEINTIPGSLSFYLWEPVGVKYPELLDRLVLLALKRRRQQEALSFSFDTDILRNFGGGAKGSKG